MLYLAWDREINISLFFCDVFVWKWGPRPRTSSRCYHGNKSAATFIKGISVHPPWVPNCLKNLKGGWKFSFPKMFDSYWDCNSQCCRTLELAIMSTNTQCGSFARLTEFELRCEVYYFLWTFVAFTAREKTANWLYANLVCWHYFQPAHMHGTSYKPMHSQGY